MSARQLIVLAVAAIAAIVALLLIRNLGRAEASILHPGGGGFRVAAAEADGADDRLLPVGAPATSERRVFAYPSYFASAHSET